MTGYNNNAAYDFSMFERNTTAPEATLNVATNKSAFAAKRITLKNIIFVVVIAALCALWVNSYAQLTEATAQVNSLSEQYETLQSDNDKLNAQYASKIDLSKIREIAINEYSMTSVDRSQVSYISLDGADMAEIVSDDSENTNIFEKLAKKVLNVIEYLG